MSFLYFLQQLRNPITDALFSVITLLGRNRCFCSSRCWFSGALIRKTAITF